MKTEENLRKSMTASIMEVETYGLLVANCAGELQEQFTGKTMSEMRGYLDKLTKAVHEYNAYYNCLYTS